MHIENVLVLTDFSHASKNLTDRLSGKWSRGVFLIPRKGRMGSSSSSSSSSSRSSLSSGSRSK